MAIEIAKLNQNIQKRLSTYLEAITQDFIETFGADKKTVKTLDNAICALKNLKKILKEMHSLCLEATPLDIAPNLNKIFEKEKRYNNLIEQLNEIAIKPTEGTINLLKGENLTINLDDNFDSGMTLNGFDATAKGLGLSNASWRNDEEIKKAVTELSLANKTVNQFLQKFYNYNLIIVTWEEFIKNLISILKLI